MATIGYRISHKDKKHTDKCSSNITETQKQNGETTNTSSKYCEDKNKLVIKYTHTRSI
jgi:hypothetical protein